MTLTKTIRNSKTDKVTTWVFLNGQLNLRTIQRKVLVDQLLERLDRFHI